MERSLKEPKKEKKPEKQSNIQLAKMGANLRNLQSLISQVHYSTCEKFHSLRKHLQAHVCHFASSKSNFATCESTCEPTCEFRPTCENTKRHLNFYLNLWFSHFSFCTATLSCEKALQVAKPKHFTSSPPLEAHKSCIWRRPLCTPPRTLWNTSLSISAMAKTRGA